MAGFFDNHGLRLLIFGGKGGCGKTTSAAAAALSLARARPDARLLLVSTDPAHSLGDALEQPIGAEETAVPRAGAAVPGAENLWAVELDAQTLDEDFRGRHGGILKEIAEQGTLFDRQDVERLFALPMPGLDEAMAILQVAEALRHGRYDVVILDTAPTGHTLRMLAMPGHMRQWNRILGLMRARRRQVALAMAGVCRESPADRFLETTERDMEGIAELLKDARSTEFVPVTVPEPMAVLETGRLVKHLRECAIAVKSIILNRMEQGHPDCELCLSRSAAQRKTMALVRESFAPCDLITVPLFPNEVRGKEALERYAEFLARPTVSSGT